MSDNATVFIAEGKDNEGKEEGFYLYAHGRGTEIAHTVKKALSKRKRWDDSSYLGRIIFCQMIKGHEEEELGFGISSLQFATRRPVIVIDAEKQQILFCEAEIFDPWSISESIVKSWSFEEYIYLSDKKLGQHWDSIFSLGVSSLK